MPSPMPRLRFVAAIFTTVAPPVSVAFSNAKSPLNRWPAIFSTMPVPSTLTYGPATTLNVRVSEPTMNCSLTSFAVLLMATLSVPVNSTPGMCSATLPPMRPASSPFLITKKPSPSERVTRPARLKAIFVAAILMTFAGAPLPIERPVYCSKEKLPVNVCPATVKATFKPSTFT